MLCQQCHNRLVQALFGPSGFVIQIKMRDEVRDAELASASPQVVQALFEQNQTMM